MVKKLLGPKREGLHPDYERENFERVLARDASTSSAASGSSRAPACCTSPAPRALMEPDRRARRRRRAARGRRRPAGLRPLLAFAHLAVLSAFALAQPLFNLLSDNPEFFAARGSTASEIIVFALLLVLVPPAVLLAIELLVGLVERAGARRCVHLVFVAALAAVVFVQALKKAIDAGDTVLIVLALALGAAAALLYHARRAGALVPQRAQPGAAAVPGPVPVLLGRVEDRAARGRQREVGGRAWRACPW